MKNTALSESQSPKNTCGTIPFIQNVENRPIGRNRKWIGGCLEQSRWGVERNRKWLLKVQTFLG